EALGQLDVEAVQAADVREDYDGEVARVRTHGERRGEAVAVRGPELERLRGCTAGDRREREIGRQVGWASVELEAHGRVLLSSPQIACANVTAGVKVLR